MLDDDNKLIEKIAAGEQAAMEVFYKKHSQMTYAFAFKTLNNEADATEVVNEVMLEVWRKAAGFEGKSKVTTWLFSITHNKAVDLVRKNTRHNRELEVEEHNEAAAHCELSLQQMDSQNKAIIQRCMTRLKSAQKEVVHLTFFSELSYKDIARILHVPEGTVKTRMMHAKSQLADCVNKLMAV